MNLLRGDQTQTAGREPEETQAGWWSSSSTAAQRAGEGKARLGRSETWHASLRVCVYLRMRAPVGGSRCAHDVVACAEMRSIL